MNTYLFSAKPTAVAGACLCACLSFSLGSAWAQVPTAPPIGNLREVIVSASRQEAFSDEQPVSADVINAQQIEVEQIHDIRDAARDLPNVSVPRGPSRFAVTGVANNTGRDGNAGFSIRGLGGNRVLMMVDGIRVPHSYVYGGNAFGRDYLSMETVKRVEIVRGASSALYGSDGLAGLVHVITHEPADFLSAPGQAAKTIGGRVAVGFNGDDHGKTYSATVAGRLNESSQWLLTVGGRNANERTTMGTITTPNSLRTAANPETDRDTSALGKWVYTPNGVQKHVVTVEHVRKQANVNLLSSRTPLPLTGTAAQVAGAILDETGSNTLQRDRITWHGRYVLATAWADQMDMVLGYQRAMSGQLGMSDRNTLSDRVRDVSYSENTWQLGAQATKNLGPAGGWERKLTYGVDALRADITNVYTGVNPLPPEVFPLKRFPDTRESSVALYAQGEWLTERTSVVPGLRLDHFSLDVQSQDGFYPPAKQPGRSLSGSAASPKLGVMFKATPAWSLFANAAGGFRAPNANQVNGYFENAAEKVLIVANPDLKPEKSRNLEVGFKGRFHGLSLDAAAFAGDYRNLIVDNVFISGEGTDASPKLFQTLNVDRARIHGFEVAGQLELGSVGGGRLAMPFSYGQAAGKNTLTGVPLNGIDPAKLMVGLDYQASTWSIRAVARHHAAKLDEDIDSASLVKSPKVQIATPGATTLDLLGQWRIRKDLRLNVGLVNVTNRKYWMWSDVRGLDKSTTVFDAYSQAGRHLNASLVMDF